VDRGKRYTRLSFRATIIHIFCCSFYVLKSYLCYRSVIRNECYGGHILPTSTEVTLLLTARAQRLRQQVVAQSKDTNQVVRAEQTRLKLLHDSNSVCVRVCPINFLSCEAQWKLTRSKLSASHTARAWCMTSVSTL
jgi:hypothetical protein